MKMLKYLMLLLAVAVAFPAMAQEMERKKVSDVESMDKPLAVKSDVVTGRLSAKNSFSVAKMADGTLVASVVSVKGTEHVLELLPNGQKNRTCYAESAGYCQHGYVHMKKGLFDGPELPTALQEFDFSVKETVRETVPVRDAR